MRAEPPRRGRLGRFGRAALQAFLRRYARREAADVASFVEGRSVLDLGAGEGYVAAALRAGHPVWTCSLEVGMFRRAPGVYVVYDGHRLPFGDRVFDTTLLLFVLHHCPDPDRVLDEALRVTRRRLIVMESVYRSRLERFWLDLLDARLNAGRHGGRMPAPLAFRRPAEWQRLFESRGLALRATRWLGPWWERLVHHPLLVVLDRPERIQRIPSRAPRSARRDMPPRPAGARPVGLRDAPS